MGSPGHGKGKKTRLVNTLAFSEPEPELCMICSDVEIEMPCMAPPDEEAASTLVNTLSFRKKKGSHG